MQLVITSKFRSGLSVRHQKTANPNVINSVSTDIMIRMPATRLAFFMVCNVSVGVVWREPWRGGVLIFS